MHTYLAVLNLCRRIHIQRFIGLIILFVYSLSLSLSAKEYQVTSVSAIHSAMKKAEPGDVIIMRNGRWKNENINITANGSSDLPILLRAETPGKVIMTGNSSLIVNGSYITVNGLLFTDGYLRKDKGHIIRLNGYRHRLTNSAIVRYNPPKIDSKTFGVTLYGRGHRIDHNHFSGQNNAGVTTVVRLDGELSGYHRIDSNYYGQRKKGNKNGFETIRIGTGKYSTTNAHVIVENNLFEEADGEIEIISNKSNDNIYQYNTFLNSAGTLTLRQGNRCLVDGNFFIGGNKEGTGGIRVMGGEHTIINNYIEGTTSRAEGALSITAGIFEKNKNKHVAYPQVNNTLIAHNTFVNNTGAALALNASLGSRNRTLLADNLTIENNIFYNKTSNSPLIIGEVNNSIQWANNIAYGADVGYVIGEGIKIIDPEFEGKNLLLRPRNTKTILRDITDSSSIVTYDIDGQKRIGNYHIGADQLSNEAIVRRPLTKKDVGPSWNVSQ